MIKETSFADTIEQAKQRREEFMQRIAGGVAVFAAAPMFIRNNDVEHEYRQDTDFYYLTGFEEPGAIAVLAPDNEEHKFVLFVQPKDREREVWTGWRAGEEGAKRDYLADTAFTLDKFNEEFPKLAAKADRLYYRFNDAAFDERIVRFMRGFQRERQRNGTHPKAIIDPAETLHEMRLVKSDDDLQLLRRAVDITCEGHIAAMKALQSNLYEYEIEAVLRYVFRKLGSPRHGYAPIVGSGANATVLHYVTNNSFIKEGDLVLIDAGAEYGYFTGDVTRTTPASGRFTKAQAEIYQLVLDAQIAAINLVKPGATFQDPHNETVRVLVEGLLRLGLLEGDAAEIIKEEKYKKFYMHRTSHWLGMDVHDVAPYKVADEWRKLEPGMVMTIEPGLYIAADVEDVDARYRGIGVRIEDDVLVTREGNEVLSARVPKTIEEIEALMQQNKF
ncbi:MAG: aminopeptidase P N-terminal domain-containing protein [Acidobacteria bacterium]|nr:aminopeptidase P N-terminal domain-containing protein [Acidobacteriota bacterium]